MRQFKSGEEVDLWVTQSFPNYREFFDEHELELIEDLKGHGLSELNDAIGTGSMKPVDQASQLTLDELFQYGITPEPLTLWRS